MCHLQTHSPLSLFHAGIDFSPFLVHADPKYLYQPLWPGPNASSVKIFLNPTFPCQEQKQLFPLSFVCTSFRALMPLGYKSLCVLPVFPKRLPAPWGLVFSYSSEGSQPQSRHFNKWLLNSTESRITETQGVDLRQMLTLVYKTD